MLMNQVDEAHILDLQWKVMVLDSGSRRIIDGVVREDDILKENVTSRSNMEEDSTGKTLSIRQT